MSRPNKTIRIDVLLIVLFFLFFPLANKVYSQLTCSDLGLISKDECRLCDEIPNADCLESRKTGEGEICYTCVEQPKDCPSIGLINKDDCGLCEEIPQAHCVSVRTVANDQECFSCVAKVKTPNPEPKIIKEKPIVKDVPKVPPPAKVSAPPPKAKVVAENPKPNPKPKPKPKPKVKPKANVVPEKVQPIRKTILPEKVSKSANADFCHAQELLAYFECGQCANCVLAGQLDDDLKCFQCSDKIGSPTCPAHGYVESCSSCKPTEYCQSTNVILFSAQGQRSAVVSCFHCL